MADRIASNALGPKHAAVLRDARDGKSIQRHSGHSIRFLYNRGLLAGGAITSAGRSALAAYDAARKESGNAL